VRFEDVLELLGTHGRPVGEEFLRRVYDFSAQSHGDQRRRSGEPYVTHPLHVAYILAGLKFDDTSVAVGLLHDVLEDTLCTRDELADRFGEEVAEIVDGVTKIGQHSYVRQDEAQAETFRKMILASAQDIRVIVVKLADRLHNMMTLEHLPPDKRRRISRETLEIYAPIAHRLGMARVQGDLEDLAFYFLYPHQFSELHGKIEEKLKVGHDLIQATDQRLRESLKEAGIEAEISFRVKRYYSIYRKLRRQEIDISQLYDYLAFRAVTTSLRDVYAVLGVVHQHWRPVPGRFKDYIAMPKPNLYQSLHTTVVGATGQPFEVQIRTTEMDLVAEEGIAAHWRYKAGKDDSPQDDPNIAWLRQLLEWQKEVQDPRTFLTGLKVDLYPDEVYVFTPKGEVMSFPRGATPVDFAYRVHTEVGHHCVGARVNGRLVPLRTALANGDQVEVMTNPNRDPSGDWLSFVVTSRAKNKIRHWLNTEQKKRAMDIGGRVLEKELRRYKMSLKRFLGEPKLEPFLSSEGYARSEDLLSAIGFGKANPRAILPRILSDEQLSRTTEAAGMLRQAVRKVFGGGSHAIEVKGQSDLLAFLAKCCNPLPGEEIVGYITRGRGVSVHSRSCPNVRNLLFHPEREIEVNWAQGREDRYQITLAIETADRPGMLARLTDAIAKLGSNITHIEADTFETGRGEITVVCALKDLKQLEKLLKGIRAIPGVIEVHRRMGSRGRGEGESAGTP